ncbi:MAG: hypothetical protein KatS3mg011_1386 [Acidimicrobiia bacterium]|nr:MAG: hypothetical protein KatS3mg011_1386 [Acidimicrobiia bacterium]
MLVREIGSISPSIRSNVYAIMSPVQIALTNPLDGRIV